MRAGAAAAARAYGRLFRLFRLSMARSGASWGSVTPPDRNEASIERLQAENAALRDANAALRREIGTLCAELAARERQEPRALPPPPSQGDLMAVGEDATERQALAGPSRLLELIFQHSLDNIVILDRDYNFIRVSESYARGCHMTAAEMVGRNHFDVFPSSLEQELAPFRQAKQIYRKVERPFVFPEHPEWGTTYWDLAMVPILDAAGEIEFHLFTLKDVTDRKRAEERTASSLREKETLLREIHHRVKNNLQVISSLLYFQGKKLHTPEVAAVFADLRQRILVMTLVHERLYSARDVARVDFGDYVTALVADLGRFFESRPGIRIDVETDDVRLPIELALPSGMIVCELVTNVLKYAFPDRSEGNATVSVRRRGAQVVIAVDDDGVGFPDGFEQGAGSSFGWELIHTLTLQLDGTVEAWTDRGAHVRVSFRAPAEGARP